ncbi:hypothetical protein ACOME3_002076 [Neoechinorhynchus agilis]
MENTDACSNKGEVPNPSSDETINVTEVKTEIQDPETQNQNTENQAGSPNVENNQTAPNALEPESANLSYRQLIKLAINSSTNKMLPLCEIYQWLIDNVEYFEQRKDKPQSDSWKNVVRHTLSLNGEFIRIKQGYGAKSSQWQVIGDSATIGQCLCGQKRRICYTPKNDRNGRKSRRKDDN